MDRECSFRETAVDDTACADCEFRNLDRSGICDVYTVCKPACVFRGVPCEYYEREGA